MTDANKDFPHRPAAFINAIREEGTKDEACAGLQKIWNERCSIAAERDALRAEVAEAKCLLEDAMEWNWIDLDELIDEGGEDEATVVLPSLMKLRQTIISFIEKETEMDENAMKGSVYNFVKDNEYEFDRYKEALEDNPTPRDLIDISDFFKGLSFILDGYDW